MFGNAKNRARVEFGGVHQTRMNMHGAFGRTGRTRGIEPKAGRVRRHRNGRVLRGCRAQQCPERLVVGVARRAARHNHLRRVLRLGERRFELRQQRRRNNERLSAAIIEHEAIIR